MAAQEQLSCGLTTFSNCDQRLTAGCYSKNWDQSVIRRHISGGVPVNNYGHDCGNTCAVRFALGGVLMHAACSCLPRKRRHVTAATREQ